MWVPRNTFEGGDSEVKMYITSIIYLLYFLQYAQGIGWLTEWGGGQTERSKCTYHQSRLLHPLRLMGKRGKMFKI